MNTYTNTQTRLMVVEAQPECWSIRTYWQRADDTWQLLTSTHVQTVSAVLGCVATVNRRDDYIVKVRG